MTAPVGSSPAERYASARDRSRHPLLTKFRADYPFQLDPFQVDACEALEAGYGVLVCAPTGAGKTVVGEFAVELALASGQKCFYTTPIKALSNQKYNDLVARHGAAQVGLLTGDNAINSGAAIVVMTTEVLRNMLYAGSPSLADLGYVVMDEVHYLGDRFRGGVWEEVIIHLPAAVRLISLSATVSNAEEFGEWLVSVRGHTRVIVHEERPVPLWQHVLVGNRLFDLFGAEDGSLNPQLRSVISERLRSFEPTPRYGRDRRPLRRWRPPHRPDVITRLDRDGLLPVIVFIFSRAGCDAAVAQCVHAGLWLTHPDDRDDIVDIAQRRTSGIPDSDLQVLGYGEWLEGLRRGIAAHHAGLIPAFKETVEELFVQGLVQVVFATETLALGINMPARSVVLERLTKFNGDVHADVTAGEYTQLTGRAGRRGIDIEGHAVVVWTPELDTERVAGLASTRTYPLRSSFRPSYNMAVNLVDQMGRAAARELLDASFAQFQADRAVSGLVKQIRRNDTQLAEYAQHLRCDKGDFTEYLELRHQLSAQEAVSSREHARGRRSEVLASLDRLQPGDVIRIPSGRRSGLAIVLDPGVARRPADEPRPLVLTEARWAGRLSLVDFPTPVTALATVKVSRTFNHRSPQARRDLAATLRRLDVPPPERPRRPASTVEEDPEVLRLRSAVRFHPCHSCPERDLHTRWAERYARLQREQEGLRHRIEGRTGSLGRTFDRICQLLQARGYLVGDEATQIGRQLGRIWSESDLVVSECLQAGLWHGLNPPELAAVVSALVYESRREERLVDQLPTSSVRDALAATERVWAEIVAAEADLGLPASREPALGFVWAAYRWARGNDLNRVLTAAADAGNELSAGDFVRWAKQLLDLLDQIATAPVPASTAAAAVANQARLAASTVRRGVVAQGIAS